MTTAVYYWILAAVLAILLFIIGRIIKKHGKRFEWIGWLSIPLAAALLIAVLLGIRSCRSDRLEKGLSHSTGQVITEDVDRSVASWLEQYEGV